MYSNILGRDKWPVVIKNIYILSKIFYSHLLTDIFHYINLE